MLALARGAHTHDLGGRRWFYCGARECDTVYFDGAGHSIGKAELQVRIGEKESDPPHTVCYCFGHTVEEIHADVARRGSTDIPDSIKAKVRAGACRCETVNPKGTCCLGDVAAVVQRAMSRATVVAPDPDRAQVCDLGPGGGACCAAEGDDPPQPPSGPRRRTTRAALWLSALTAAGASACCWLPLLLAVVGASSVGVAVTLEGMRPYLLVLAPLFLGTSFYMLYLRRTPCAEGCSCSAKRGHGSRAARGFFWVAAGLLIVSLAFPAAMGALLGGSGPTHDGHLAELPALEFRIHGMTCASCAAAARAATKTVAGVVDARADHARGSLTVWYRPDAKPDPEAVRRVLVGRGYELVGAGMRLPKDRYR